MPPPKRAPRPAEPQGAAETAEALREERRLLAAHRAGDAEAFDLLVRPHVASLLSLARRLAGPHWGEDLLQEALLKAFRGLAGFRGEASLRTWLFTIVIRLAREPSRWRREEREPMGPLAEDIPEAMGHGPEAHARERELRDRLEEGMERLPARQRTALHLRAAEGLDYRRIASCMETTEPAARRLVLSARRSLLRRLGPHLLP